jgi:hypothetical protein
MSSPYQLSEHDRVYYHGAWMGIVDEPAGQSSVSWRQHSVDGNPSANDVSVEDCGAGMVVSGRS